MEYQYMSWPALPYCKMQSFELTCKTQLGRQHNHVYLCSIHAHGTYLFKTLAMPKSPSLTVPDFVRKMF